MSLSGNGIFVFNVISTISSMASNFIITSLIILIAGGWSITFIDLGNILLKLYNFFCQFFLSNKAI
jgi:hypothetical protein